MKEIVKRIMESKHLPEGVSLDSESLRLSETVVVGGSWYWKSNGKCWTQPTDKSSPRKEIEEKEYRDVCAKAKNDVSNKSDKDSADKSSQVKKQGDTPKLTDDDVDRLVGKWEEKSGDSVLDGAYGKVRKAEAAYHMTTKRAEEYAAKLENKMRKEKGIPSLSQRLSYANQKKFEADIKDIQSKVSKDPEYLRLSKEADKAIGKYANTTYDLKKHIRDAKSKGVKYPHEYYRASIQWDDHD